MSAQPQHQPGDIVNGHQLTEQPDGSLAWVPLPAEPAPSHQPGDIVNGHQLVQQADGSMQWMPIVANASAKTGPKKWLIIGGAVAGVVVLATIVGAVNGGKTVKDETATKPTAAAERVTEPEAPAAPEKITVPDTTGMTAGQAVSVLRAAGFEVADPADAGAIVTGTSPAQGGIAEVGSAVSLAVEPPKPKFTLEQENAIKEAQRYIDIMSFSKAGLIDQLSSEYGSAYPLEVAQFAVEHITVDWNAEAAEQAQQYLDTMSFSRDALYDQLTSEYGGQFTPEEANYGLSAVGY